MLSIASISLQGCNPKSGDADTSPNVAFKPEGSEPTYNATPISYSGDLTTVTGTALFTRYNDGDSGLTTTSDRPIRHAEVHLLNSTGTVIQAGETDASGNFSLAIPRTAGTYSVSVNSRADNAYLKASVLNNPYDKVYFSLKQSFTLDGSETTKSLSLPSAPHNGTLEGGAFNILDNVFIANQFLRDEANDPTDCPSSAGCSNDFTVAPKVQIYWTKGLSPGVYYGAADVGISFFVPVSVGGLYRGMYILGGIQDNLCTDTDHFDNSVILHEYGHFLEDAFGKSASPGGSHSGDELLDPRLAWSEGWADFFQAAALGRNFYRDTNKNADCSGGAKLSFPDFKLESKTNGQDWPQADEGIFREVSVARALFDTVTGENQNAAYNLNYTSSSAAPNDQIHADQSFSRVWQVFKAMSGSSYHFQNGGMFNQGLVSFLSAAPISMSFPNSYSGNSNSVLDNEKQAKDRSLYGTKLNPTAGAAGACAFTVASGTPNADEVNSQGQVEWSDPLRNNDFYEYHYDGTAATAKVYLKYDNSGFETGDATTAKPYDLDLYAYRNDYVFLDGSTIVDSDERGYPEATATSYDGQAEIDLTGQATGVYMLNVKVAYTSLKSTTTYYLHTASGAQLCP